MSEKTELTSSLTFRVSGPERLVIDHASRVTTRTLSEFIRAAVVPAAHDAVVAHAIRAPLDAA